VVVDEAEDDSSDPSEDDAEIGATENGPIARTD